MSVYGEFEVVLSSQQLMNLAALIAHCCVSPNRYGGLLASGASLKSLHAFVMRGKCVFLMYWSDWHGTWKCSSATVYSLFMDKDFWWVLSNLLNSFLSVFL